MTRRPWRLLAGVVLAGLLAGAWFSWPSLQQWRERREALGLSQQGRFAEAEPLLKRTLERDKNDVAVVKALGLGYFDAHKDDEAESYLRRWQSLQPEQSEPRERLMELLVRQVKVSMTLDRAERVPEADADLVEMQKREILSLLIAGRHADAEQLGRRYLESRPRSITLRYLLAEACHVQGKDEEARNLLDRLLQEQPRHKDALVRRALLYSEADQADKAIPLLRQVLAQDRWHTTARYHLSQALARLGQTAEAEREMAEMLRHKAAEHALHDMAVQPNNVELQLKAAEALLNGGRSAEGIRLLGQILARYPGHDDALRLLAKDDNAKSQPGKPNP